MVHGIITKPLYAANIYYYAELLKVGEVYFNINEAIGKSRAFNRCNIIGANGLQKLTIPVVKPVKGMATPLKEIEISNHGNWEHIHWGAIFSAYGKTPFFEYVADDLKHLYDNRSHWLVDFNIALHNLITDFLSLPITTVDCPNEMIDLNRAIGELNCEYPKIGDVEYYQIRKERYGFMNGLSIFDLLMNEGSQAILTLNKMIKL